MLRKVERATNCNGQMKFKFDHLRKFSHLGVHVNNSENVEKNVEIKVNLMFKMQQVSGKCK